MLVLNPGTVVGLGMHQELLLNCPTYRRLWEAQRDFSSEEFAVGSSEEELAEKVPGA
jgi:hypothetical protein